MAKRYFFRSLTIVLGSFLFACAPSKFNYHQAYKFSQYKYQNDPHTTDKHTIASDGSVNLLASTTPDLEPTMYADNRLSLTKVSEALENESNFSNAVVTRKIKREKRKAFRKEVKTKVKDFIKERKEWRKQNKKKGKAMNRKVYTGLIIAGAGLIVAILASGTIGALAIIVGIALIAWGLIEEGT